MDNYDYTTSATFDNIFLFSEHFNGTASSQPSITLTFDLPADKDWMPYAIFEYEPIWHKKFAKIKYQMKNMWD